MQWVWHSKQLHEDHPSVLVPVSLEECQLELVNKNGELKKRISNCTERGYRVKPYVCVYLSNGKFFFRKQGHVIKVKDGFICSAEELKYLYSQGIVCVKSKQLESIIGRIENSQPICLNNACATMQNGKMQFLPLEQNTEYCQQQQQGEEEEEEEGAGAEPHHDQPVSTNAEQVLSELEIQEAIEIVTTECERLPAQDTNLPELRVESPKQVDYFSPYSVSTFLDRTVCEEDPREVDETIRRMCEMATLRMAERGNVVETEQLPGL